MPPPNDGGTGDAGFTDAGADVEADVGASSTTCVGSNEPVYKGGAPGRCAAMPNLSVPRTGPLIDLSNAGVGSAGSCGPFAASHSVISIDPSLGFPQRIRLPAVSGIDAACTTLCDLGPTSTAFGIAFEIPADSIPGRIPAIRVPAPWFIASANERDPTPCLDGRPSVLEFGAPLACVAMYGRGFGFATTDPNAPSVDATVELLDEEDVPNTMDACCPYLCQP